MADVAVRDLVKVYGRHLAVRGIDLDIPDGAFTVFVGPSGCGKSTTLRMIAGLETISHGDLLVDGARVNDLPSRERGVAMVFQSYALYPHKTVRQNLEFSLKLEKLPRGEIARRVDEAVEVLELAPYLDRKPASLSGGQRQRVAMGRAIVRHPKVFLFDEPLSNLDAMLRNQMRVEIKRLQRRLGVTTIYVTHDQVEAMTMADIVVVMREGRIEQSGAPIHVFENPANRFVAGFIGTPQMNFFDAEVAPGGRLSVAGTDLSMEIPAGRFETLSPGRKVTLGFRSEDVSPVGHGLPTAASRIVPAPVEFVEMLGNETLIFGTLGGTGFVSRMQRPREVAPGEVLEFEFHLDRMHLFDAETGASLRRADDTTPITIEGEASS